ncbi:hypothetical protein N9M73_07395 [Rhodobacteraceae bacterium]|nr:hypothetical protein [Paracoccaceae bacterium]
MNIKLTNSVICLLLFLQFPNSCKAGELSYTLHFNGFRYDKIAVTDALSSFLGVESEDLSNQLTLGSEQFEASIQQMYFLAFDILDLTFINRVGIEFKQELGKNVMFNVSLSHGRGSGKYGFPDGLSILSDPAIMYSRFSENLLSLSLEKQIFLSEKTYIFCKAGSNFAAVDIDTHITSALLNVRSSKTHHITYPEYTLGVRFVDGLSVSPSISFDNLKDPRNSISISLSISQSF